MSHWYLQEAADGSLCTQWPFNKLSVFAILLHWTMYQLNQSQFLPIWVRWTETNTDMKSHQPSRFDPEDEGSMYLRNVGNTAHINTVQ
jgi:hypothetical protein